jgi:hypothetical protein
MKYILILMLIGFNLNANEMKDLVWQDSDDAKLIKKDWKGAKDYCEALVLGQKDDWRLPNVKELQSIVDISVYKPAIKREFKNVSIRGYYWSSTVDISTDGYAWNIDFNYGNTLKDSMLNELYVRCVRGEEVY